MIGGPGTLERLWAYCGTPGDIEVSRIRKEGERDDCHGFLEGRLGFDPRVEEGVNPTLFPCLPQSAKSRNFQSGNLHYPQSRLAC